MGSTHWQTLVPHMGANSACRKERSRKNSAIDSNTWRHKSRCIGTCTVARKSSPCEGACLLCLPLWCNSPAKRHKTLQTLTGLQSEPSLHSTWHHTVITYGKHPDYLGKLCSLSVTSGRHPLRTGYRASGVSVNSEVIDRFPCAKDGTQRCILT